MAKTCLVVDDDSVGNEVASVILENLGLNVLTAYDGKEALEICKDRLPDAILLDLYMPEMDGLEFLQEIRKIETLKRLEGNSSDRIVIIICSAEDKQYKVGQTAHAGADDYIVKPYHSGTVEEKLVAAGIL